MNQDTTTHINLEGHGLPLLSSIDTFPIIDLYLDQVLGIVQEQLQPLVPSDEKIITGSMVNNYVKHRLIPTPVKKKYNRKQVATLVVICFFKQVYSMAEVSRLLEIAEKSGLADIDGYDSFVSLVNKQYTSCMRALDDVDDDAAVMDDEAAASTEERRLFMQAIASVCKRAVVGRELRKTQD